MSLQPINKITYKNKSHKNLRPMQNPFITWNIKNHSSHELKQYAHSSKHAYHIYNSYKYIKTVTLNKKVEG